MWLCLGDTDSGVMVVRLWALKLAADRGREGGLPWLSYMSSEAKKSNFQVVAISLSRESGPKACSLQHLISCLGIS